MSWYTQTNKQTNKQSNKQKLTIYINTLVWSLDWVVETQERKKDRSLVIITIPIPQSTPNIQIHPLQNNIYVSKVYCGSSVEQGTSGLPYYCTSICVRSWCNWRASCVNYFLKQNSAVISALPVRPQNKKKWGYLDSLLETAREAPTIASQDVSSWAQHMWQKRQSLSVCIWFQDLHQFMPWVNCPCAPEPLNLWLFLNFCAIFFSSCPSFFWSARFAK